MTDPLKTVRDALAAALPGCRVATEVPPGGRPDPLVTLRRTGGPSDAFLESPSLTVTCWAAPDPGHSGDRNAAALATRARDALLAIPDGDPWVSEVEVAGTYRNDRADGTPRYSIQCRLTVNQE